MSRTESLNSEADGAARGAPISAALALILGAMVLLAVLLVIAIATWTGYRNTVDLLRQKAEIMVSSAVDQLHIHLDAAESQAHFVSQALATGWIDAADPDDLVTLLTGALAATPQITSIGYVDTALNLVAAERDEPTPVPIFARLADDPTWQTLLAEAQGASEAYWGGVSWRHVYGTAQLTRREPVRRNGGFAGFVYVEVGIPSLSELIGSLESDFGLNAFILAGDRNVIAHPMLQFGFPGLTPWHPVPGVSELGDPVLMAMSDPRARNDRVSALLGRSKGHAVDLGAETYVFVYREERGYGGDWLVGSYLTASDVLKEIERLFNAIVACAAIILLALLLAAWLGRRISRPVRLLAEQSRRVRNLDFEHTRPVPGSYIKELNEAAAAFNQMVDGLRERQMIRDLFGKYVPKGVVDELLKDKGKLRPRQVEATVLFVDVERFTTLSEDLLPQQIVDILNAYFSGVAAIIERHGGMITQFQGDAVLAVFNLPVADPAHADHAVAAASEIRRFVAENRFQDRQLRCRIGINTGEVVAGNVGATDRLSYTVHGDAVNVAARLDDLNKTLGTGLLISASTAGRLDGREIAMRSRGRVPIRGKQSEVEVFEVL
ncbi:MAG: HAMP domain-containing protein [Chromatiaceae bacterium]|nr:HAMP domain-containing protein [Chromatiaceae bacterium]MCP5312138.1 HAMP domain-containing protein [Chromatiaceae bacterium]